MIYLSFFYVIPAPAFARVNSSRNPSSLLETVVRLPAKAGKAISPHKMNKHLAYPSYKKKKMACLRTEARTGRDVSYLLLMVKKPEQHGPV
jgi:hypothetical protein